MAMVRKCFGTFPEGIAVLSEVAEFAVDGIAEVSEEVAEVLRQVPGYEVLPEKKYVIEEVKVVPEEVKVVPEEVKVVPEEVKVVPEEVKVVSKPTTTRRQAPKR